MSEWIRPDGCESGACVEYRTVGDAVFVRNGGTENLSDDGNMLQFTVAEWGTFVAGLVAERTAPLRQAMRDGNRLAEEWQTKAEAERDAAFARANEAARLSAEARDRADDLAATIEPLREQIRDLEGERLDRDVWACNLAATHNYPSDGDPYEQIRQGLCDLAAENARLRQDVDRYKGWLATANKELNAVQVELAITSDQLSDSRAMCDGHVDPRDLEKALTQRDAAIAEAAVLRYRDRRTQAVVAEACTWRHRVSGLILGSHERPLRDAVDALESDPLAALSATEPAEQPQPVAQSTDGPEPQGEAQRDDEAIPRAITRDWMAHLGYEPGEIDFAEADIDHSGCEMTTEGWDCVDENGEYAHATHQVMSEVAELVMFVLDSPHLNRPAPLTEVLPEPNTLAVTMDNTAATFKPTEPLMPVTFSAFTGRPCACSLCATARRVYAANHSDGEVPEAGRAGEAQTKDQDRTEVGLDAAIEASRDVPGLAEAIVAAGAAVDAYVGNGPTPPTALIIGLAVRAASALIERAALNAAADIEVASPDGHDNCACFELGVEVTLDAIRDRATRTETP